VELHTQEGGQPLVDGEVLVGLDVEQLDHIPVLAGVHHHNMKYRMKKVRNFSALAYTYINSIHAHLSPPKKKKNFRSSD
jgi:hypothetical protein